MEFGGIAEGCQLGNCLIWPNPKRSMKNWRNNDGLGCAQKSAGMGGIGWGGGRIRFPRLPIALGSLSSVLVGRLNFRMPNFAKFNFNFFNFFKFAPFPQSVPSYFLPRRLFNCQVTAFRYRFNGHGTAFGNLFNGGN